MWDWKCLQWLRFMVRMKRRCFLIGWRWIFVGRRCFFHWMLCLAIQLGPFLTLSLMLCCFWAMTHHHIFPAKTTLFQYWLSSSIFPPLVAPFLPPLDLDNIYYTGCCSGHQDHIRRHTQDKLECHMFCTGEVLEGIHNQDRWDSYILK